MFGNGVLKMKLIYEGKTKNVYEHPDGHIVLKFKDDMTGTDGVFDPGADTVGLTVEGIGKSGLRMTKYFFELLNEQGFATHFLQANINDATMEVKRAKMLGHGLEVICRFRAVGSFYRRYALYCEEGQPLDALVEITIKDDERGDPPISKEALVNLKVLTAEQYDVIKQLTKDISTIVKDELAKKGLELYDIKLEFGYDTSGDIMLIDEISAGNMRVYKNGQIVSPFELEKLFFN